MTDPGQFLSEGALFHRRYEVVRLLGAGGMGAVYEVRDDKTRRRRALKVMLPQMVANEDMRRRFEREAVVAADIQSDHVAETLDAGIDDTTGAPFIVMELLEGQSMERLVGGEGLSATTIPALLAQAALALDKAHAAGVVHRDLKPENLFVTYADDGSPRLKILDFGIAKVMQETLSAPETRGILGSPMYMAPEQMHGEAPISPRTDLFALGQVAYTLLVGEPYWAQERETSDGIYPLLVKMMNGPPEPPVARARRRRGVELPPTFDGWFARATAASPEERFGRADELVAALATTLGVEPLLPSTDLERQGASGASGHAASPATGAPNAEATVAVWSRTQAASDGESEPVAPSVGLPMERSRWPWGVAIAGSVGVLLWWMISSGSSSSPTTPATDPEPEPPASSAALLEPTAEAASPTAARTDPVAPPAASASAVLAPQRPPPASQPPPPRPLPTPASPPVPTPAPTSPSLPTVR